MKKKAILNNRAICRPDCSLLNVRPTKSHAVSAKHRNLSLGFALSPFSPAGPASHTAVDLPSPMMLPGSGAQRVRAKPKEQLVGRRAVGVCDSDR